MTIEYAASTSGLESRWSNLFLAEEGRLEWRADGIVVDRKCTPGQSQPGELEFRREVAQPFLQSREEAMSEATRHHSRGVMLRRAAQQVAKVRSAFRDDERIVVDLGCGFGWQWMELSAAMPSTRFVLVDFALTNLQVCRNLMPIATHPNVLCVQASILDLPLRDALASLVWSVQVMQHIADPERVIAFREARRILHGGGAFYIAWVRSVPVIRALSTVFGRHYHQRGRTQQGLYLDRFDDSIRVSLLDVFPTGRVTHSESLFHPELRLRPRASWVGRIDLALSASPLGGLITRQAEFSGER